MHEPSSWRPGADPKEGPFRKEKGSGFKGNPSGFEREEDTEPNR